MLHEHDDEDDVKGFEELAKTYDNEKEIVIARIDVDKQRPLRREFRSIEYPCFYWYSKGKDTKRKRYGGQMNLKQMIHFVNAQTGFQRLSGGRLEYTAGLIEQLDEIVEMHIKDLYEVQNLNGLILKLKKAVAKLNDDEKELGEYYIHLVEEVKEDNTIDSLGEARNRPFRSMEDIGPVRKDMLLKKTHITNKFVDLIAEHVMGDMGLPMGVGMDMGMGVGGDDIVKTLDPETGFKDRNSEGDPDSYKNPIIFREEL